MTETEAILQKVTDLVGHLRWRVGAPGPGDLAAADLAGNPDRLATAVAATSEGRGSDDSQVLGSLWWQAYAYRVAGTTAACWVLGGAAPDPAIEAGTAVGIARSRPSSVIYGADSRPVVERKELATRLFDDHLDVIANRLRQRHALGEQLIWGNAAAGIASALSAVGTAAGIPSTLSAVGTAAGAPPLRERADELIGALPHRIEQLGQWPTPWTYHRRTCCLWWKTTVAGGRLCEDCSLR